MTKPRNTAPKFESALSELEAIVSAMESGKISLDDALAQYRRGATLLHECQNALRTAEQQIAVLEGDVLRDLPHGTDNDPADR